jgi:mRNA-degrading endonuclease RelE of RelBE toxin-antitoxin system
VSPPYELVIKAQARRALSARRGHYRVRHRIDEDKHPVVIIDIAARSDVYDPGRA